MSDGGGYNGMMLWRSYGGGSDLSGGQPIRLSYTANGNLWRQMGTGATSWGTWNKFAIGTGTTAQYIRGDASLATFPTIPPDPTGVYLPLAGGIMSGNIGRSAYNSGYQVGGYNNVGASEQKTNPIHAIGTSYLPTATALSNMYGIGYTNSGASFIQSTDLGTTPASSWGAYIASDGNARWFCNSNSGITHQLGIAYASNFTLNSDKRKKKKIKKYKPKDLGIKWKNFELKTEPGQYRVGVIAQELLETAPELVNQEDPENYTVNSFDILNAAMAWKDKQIDDLTARVEKLELLIKKLT